VYRQFLQTWDPTTGKERHYLLGRGQDVNSDYETAVGGLCFGRDGRTLAAAYIDGTVRLWDTERGEELRILRPYPAAKGIHQAVFSPDGRHLAVVCFGDVVLIVRLDRR
jgi:WD40 repeat protein